MVPPTIFRLVGRTLVGGGLMLIGFTFYQLWGTGLVEWQAQQELASELSAMLEEGTTPDPGTSATNGSRGRLGHFPLLPEATDIKADGTGNPADGAFSTTPEAQDRPSLRGSDPAEGDVLARLEIPSIGVSKTIVEGVERDTLRQAPGRYPSSALPGESGNVAIAGHRTTHGAPFFDLDQVQVGDEIKMQTVDGTFTYQVQGHEAPDGGERAYAVVDPSAVEVIANQGDNRLTLTACEPKYSARQRIVVSALLIDGPDGARDIASAVPPVASPLNAWPALGSQPSIVEQASGADAVPPAELAAAAGEEQTSGPQSTDDLLAATDSEALEVSGAQGLEDSLGWQPHELDPTVLWITVLALTAHLGWILGRFWRPRWAYLATAPVAVVPLFLFYLHLDRLLPAF